MRNTGHQKRSRLLPTTAACVAALSLVPQGVWAQAIQVEAQGGAAAEIQVQADVALVDLAIVNGVAGGDSMEYFEQQPGFSLNLAEPEFHKQMSQLDAFLAESDWAKAFRLLTELDNEQLQVMVPLGEDGKFVLVKELLQRQLLSLPPDGRRAFRLYFDGQAQEQLEQVKNHPLPGSEEQLALAQALVDRMLPTSIGGEAATLLGDMYFGRGLFEQAERSWRNALDQGSATGNEALQLQAKRTLALQRAGKLAEAAALLDGLKARYGQATMQAGGEQIDALALLGQMLEADGPADQTARVPSLPENLLPTADAMPQWHLQFLDRVSKNAVNQVRGSSSWYSPPNDILKYVPPVVADEQRVYFQWQGVVFALHRESGKILWRSGSIRETANLTQNRIQSNHGDPRNYQIAVDPDALLVSSPLNTNQNSAFILRAYFPENGQEIWSSNTRQDWSLNEPGQVQKSTTSILGEVLVHNGWGYAIVSNAGQSDLYLRRFSPATGEVAWTIALGTATKMTFQYTQVSRAAQPSLMMGPSLLYVMTNNGALLAVDVVASEVKWAVRTEAPFGVGPQQSNNNLPGNRLGPAISGMVNTNGSGRMLLQDKTLYAKEHNGKALYALDPTSGKIKWSADKLKPDAKLIGLDDKHFFLMDKDLQSYEIAGEHDLAAKNGSIGMPDHAGAVLAGEEILIYSNTKLKAHDTKHLDSSKNNEYLNDDYLGQRGGHLYVFGDLLVAIDTTQITAFKIPENNE